MTATSRLQAALPVALGDGGNRPFIHLVDSGVSDNVGMRSVLAVLDPGGRVNGQSRSGHRARVGSPRRRIFAIDVSFAALDDKAEREFLNGLPTTWVLPDEAVDRLRAADGTIIWNSPEFQRLLKEGGATIVTPPVSKP